MCVLRCGVWGTKESGLHRLHHTLLLRRLPLPPRLQLRHSDSGLVSISLAGDELCITTGRALMMDETHQVGRGVWVWVCVWRGVGG